MKCIAYMMVVLSLAASLFARGGTEKKAPTYPSKQIRMIVQTNPGESSDVNCRTIAPGVEKALGVPVVNFLPKADFPRPHSFDPDFS